MLLATPWVVRGNRPDLEKAIIYDPNGRQLAKMGDAQLADRILAYTDTWAYIKSVQVDGEIIIVRVPLDQVNAFVTRHLLPAE